jgi:hypothetical protein
MIPPLPPPPISQGKLPYLKIKNPMLRRDGGGGGFEIAGLDGKLKNNNNNKCMGVPHANGIYWEVLREYSQD